MERKSYLYKKSETDKLVKDAMKCSDEQCMGWIIPLIARFMGPTWGLPGADRAQVGHMNFAIWVVMINPGHVFFNTRMSKTKGPSQ